MNFQASGMACGATVVAAVAILFAATGTAWAHCDTMDGPVVAAARTALEKGDVAPVLKWIKKDYEPEIREAFHKTLGVRAKGPDARDLADHYFFETLVRVHRAGEGAPYTGLKSTGAEVSPAVVAADKALETGSADEAVKLVTGAAAAGIRQRFAHAAEARQHADESVEAGRRFVEAYVEYTHYLERLYEDAKAHAGHHESPPQAEEHAVHHETPDAAQGHADHAAPAAQGAASSPHEHPEPPAGQPPHAH